MDQLHNGAPPRAKWQKLLYIKQDYPDNYVDKSFLNLMKRNVNVRQLSFWNVVGESCRVSQQLSVITLFVAVFVHLYRDDETNSDPGISNSSINASTANKIVWEPLHLVIGSCIVTILLYLFWMYLAIQNASRSGTSDSFVPKTVSGVVLFFTMLMGLTPILKNLTKDISSDSIWFMTILMFIANMLFHDYGASFSTKARFPESLSINAAMFASVLLASRLSRNTSVFALLLLAIQLFALFPILRRSLRLCIQPPVACDGLLSVVLIAAATALLGHLSRVAVVFFVGSMLFITFLCPSLLVVVQKYKSEIRGPWDEAEIRTRS